MITEKQAKQWFCKYHYLNMEINCDYRKCKRLETFINIGKEENFIEKSYLEKAREKATFFMTHKCYTITDDSKLTLHGESDIIADPHIILKQDLNRIITSYELAIKEIEERNKE